MKPRQLREKITNELALTWLREPGHAFALVAFAQTHGVSAVDVGRALVRLQDAGHVRVNRSKTLAGVSAVLTPFGQREWVSGAAESNLPGCRAQMRQVFEYAMAAESTSAHSLQAVFGLSAVRVHQLVLMLRSVGSVQAAVDAAGCFTDIRVHPRLLAHALADLEDEMNLG